MARLGPTGLTQVFTDIKNWVNSKLSTKADTAHTHTTYAVKHAYTTAANAAKNWYRIANANTKQVYTGNPIHAEFILTAYNSSYDPGYSERWYVRAMVLGRNAHVTVFGGNTAPFSQCRVLYENTLADIDDNDRPAIDIYLNYVLANGTTKIEIEEVYNQGWTFVADGQLAASTVPTGFENTAIGVRGNGVERSTYSDIATYLNKPRRDITSDVTLADNSTYRSTTLNCTGTRTITLPSINSAYFWCVIKNFNAEAGIITIHPSTTSVLIDGSNDDIVLRPGEFVTIHSRADNSFSIVGDNRKRTCLVGRSGVVGTDTKHWFRVAQKTIRTTYRDAFILLDVFQIGSDSNNMGRLCAHVRVDGTVGVVGNKQFSWLYRGTQLSDDDFAMTTIETSGTSVVVDIWCKRSGSYSAFAFAVVSEGFSTDSSDSPAGKWILTRARATVGDLETLDTGFTTVTNPSVVTLANSITGNAGSATTAQQVRKDPAAGSTADLLYSQCAGTDIFRLQVGGASNAGYVEIATADDGSEPIYVRQYKGTFTSLQRTATLLDGSGNTSFPGQVTGATFNGPLTWSGTAFSYNAGNSLYFYSGQPAIANCFEGSSNDFTKFSYPTGGTSVSTNNANIQTLRLDWGSTYWHDLFMSPNNNYLWHRNVVNSDARGWRRIVEENVTGLTDQSWNINIAGTAANVTGTVTIAHGGTGATTRLDAVKNLTNESVGTPTHFLAITTNWGKAGYTTVAQAKTVLGITGDMGSHSDSEYVHKTGNETISGDKTFANSKVIVGRNTDVGSAIQLINSDVVGDSANGSSGFEVYGSSISDDNKIGGLTVGEYSNNGGAYATIEVNRTVSGVKTTTAIRSLIRSDGSKEFSPSTDNDIKLGHSSFRWSAIYGNTYYYGSNNVEFSTKFVTTDTAQTVTGTKTFNGDKLVITQGNGYRMVCNNDGGASGYGVFQRVDSANWYLMVTAQNDALGTWTSARPASMNLSTGVLSINGNAGTATQFSANKDVTLTGDVTGTASSKAGWSVATTLANSGVTAGTYGPSADVTGNNNATISVPEITVDAKGRVTSVTNRTLTCKNNTYNVYNKTLTIQKNGTNVATFTSNSNTDVTANITVPTKVSELTNDSGYLTSHQSLSNYVTLNGAQTISGIKTISTHLRFSSANTRGTAPSANEERDLIDYKDSAGMRISLFETMYYTDKSSKTSIYAYKTTAATGGNIGSIGIGCDASGNVYTYAPTPASLDNSTKIATTAFVYNTAAKHLAAATNIYVAKVATGNGSGSNTSNYMALADLRTYLATVHMHSSASNMNGSYNLQILFKAGDSFGDATFDATKMPGVRNLILNTSTGTNSTVNNYSTNSPTFGNINVTGDIAVTMRNLNCTGRISSQHGAYVSIDTYMGISSLMAGNYGYLNVAKNMVINVCDAHVDYLFSAVNNGILAMWPGATVTINFRQQCYYTRSLFYAASNGTAWIGYSSFKLTGTEPMAVWGGSGTLTGTSETAAATVEKAVTLASGQTFTLATNATAKVKFTVDNTAANPTLNIGGTGAKPIYWNNAPVQATMLMKNITYDVKYNGSQFVIQNAVKRLTNNDFGVFRSNGNYNQTYNSGSWNFTGWTLYYGTGIENSNWRGSHIGNIQQNVSTSNNTYPVLISGTANATANASTAPYFAKGVKINPSTNSVYATNFYEDGTALSSKYVINENFGKGTTTWLYIKATDFPTGSGPGASIQYNDAVDGTKLYVWLGVCGSSSILSITLTAAQVTGSTGQVWRYLGPTIYAAGLGNYGASPTGILGLFRRES